MDSAFQTTIMKISLVYTKHIWLRDLLILLLGGWAQYAIQSKDDSQLEGCYAGVNTALNYYVKYKKVLGKDKGAEKFLKMREKGTLKSYLAKSMPE